ncbi:molybdopterin-dependent oxidoreductase [Robertmurraya korlensis]|uniref:molybdopterin-dependent oxidoreductase n=1 Tax=Robertmurraya korlensis TaxID=519977 RepID=UPI000825DC68|nr:molybdopterin-dependent oxidoreductase [Robertmurraya korlensis]
MAKTYTSACPLNCWDSCGFKVTVEDGKVTRVEGDETHPITKGKICGRGRMLEARTNSTDRIVYPLKKMNDEFHRISWAQALDEIAEKMSWLKRTKGTTSILHSHDYANGGLLKNLDQRFFNCFGGVTELTGSLCWGAGIEAQNWDFGDAYSHAPGDVLNSKNIVIWGRNVARTNMHFYSVLLEAKRNGATIYVIDPLYNATAKLANKHITVKPGTDGFLAVGVMKELLRLKLADIDFIEKYTVGFDHVHELIDTVSLDEISRITEVSIDVITELAYLYGDRPTSTYLGLGMQRYGNGGNTIRLIDALVAISGNIGIRGGGANYANKQVGQSFQLGELTLQDRRKEARNFTMMKQAKGIVEAVNPMIDMIIVTCGNPIAQVPNTNEMIQAFSSVDTVVVIDSFMTDTAELADYILPTTTAFEEEDIYYSSMYHHYANYGPKLVEAPGEAKSDLWIWTELAKRLGFGEDFNFTRDEWMTMAIQHLEDKGITLQTFKEDHHVELPVDEVPWSDFHFKTPSGKYEFLSSHAVQKGEDGRLALSLPNESIVTTPDLAKKYPYQLLTIHPMRSNHSQHYHLFAQQPKLQVELASNIAESLNLAENDFIEVWNDRGKVKGYVHILSNAHPNTINIDEGIWKKYGGSVNLLTPSEESDNGLGSTLYDCLVNIRKIEQEEAAN